MTFNRSYAKNSPSLEGYFTLHDVETIEEKTSIDVGDIAKIRGRNRTVVGKSRRSKRIHSRNCTQCFPLDNCDNVKDQMSILQAGFFMQKFLIDGQPYTLPREWEEFKRTEK